MADELDLSNGRRERRDPTVIVFLSIFLLLVGFFILLNAISEEDELRAELAMGSVVATFSSTRTTPSDRIAAGTRAGISKTGHSFKDALEGLFEKTLLVETERRQPPGSVLQVTLSPLRIFRHRSVAFHSRSHALMSAMADLLSKPDSGRRYEVEMLLGAGPGLSRDQDRRRDFLARRAAAFAARLRALGVPGSAIRVGLDSRRPEEIELTFFDLNVDRARVSFGHLVR